jgi:glycosyltransferase involved in cell wall biosynthesis
MNKPLLSVITVVYNGAATLEKTILSVAGQTFKDMEYIIIDGGSKDATIDIIQKHAAHVTKWISEPDKGVYDAMNKGVRMAEGEWIYFLGGDDLFHDSQVVSRVFAEASPADADLVYGDVLSPSYKGRYDGEFDFAKLLVRNISHQAIFYRRTLFATFGEYNLRYKGYADWDLNIRLFAANDSPEGPRVRIRYVDTIVASFGPGGISSRHDIPFLREVLLPRKLKWLEENGMDRLRPLTVYDDLWRTLRNAGFSKAGDLTGEKVPLPVRQMAVWQEHIPRGALKIGPLSKLIMLASYLRHLLNGKLH